MAGGSRELLGLAFSRAEAPCVDSPPPAKRLRLRRAGRCVVCARDLAVGDEAVWHREVRQVTCVGCPLDEVAVAEGKAGASALREYKRRHQRREDHAREKLGGFGVLLARVVDEPTSTKASRQGANGEVRSAARLAKHLEGGPGRGNGFRYRQEPRTWTLGSPASCS